MTRISNERNISAGGLVSVATERYDREEMDKQGFGFFQRLHNRLFGQQVMVVGALETYDRISPFPHEDMTPHIRAAIEHEANMTPGEREARAVFDARALEIVAQDLPHEQKVEQIRELIRSEL